MRLLSTMRIVFATLTIFSALLVISVSASFPPLPSSIGSALSGLAESVVDGLAPQVGSALSGLAESVVDGLTPQDKLEKLWEEVQKLGSQAGQVVLDEVTNAYPETARVIGEFKDAATQVVEQAHKTRMELQEMIEKRDITIEHVTHLLSREIGTVYEQLRDEVNDPLPEDRGERAKARAQRLAQTMQGVRVAYIHVLAEVNVPREQAEEQFEDFASKITHLLLIIGNIIDEYPILLDILIIAASILLSSIPIFGPILQLFGFGPLGPIKGSAAAWLQKVFWGGAVAKGSWFAILQGLGMTWANSWVEKVALGTGLAAILKLTTKS